MSDESRIIARLNARDEQILHEIRETYGKLCGALAFRMLGNREDAEECVNDMLLSVWNSIPPNLPVSLEAYLVTLVRRAAIDRLRTEHRQKRGGTQFAQALDELAEVLPANDSVESEIEQRELNRALREFLETLTPEPRHIFMQRYFMSMPLQEIASANGMNLSAVKMSLSRTRKKLRDYLEKGGFL